MKNIDMQKKIYFLKMAAKKAEKQQKKKIKEDWYLHDEEILTETVLNLFLNE